MIRDRCEVARECGIDIVERRQAPGPPVDSLLDTSGAHGARRHTAIGSAQLMHVAVAALDTESGDHRGDVLIEALRELVAGKMQPWSEQWNANGCDHLAGTQGRLAIADNERFHSHDSLAGLREKPYRRLQ